MNFKDYYKFPLKSMPGLEKLKVLTDDNQMAFDWCQKIAQIDIENFINKINGNFLYPKLFESKYNPEEGIVYFTFKEETNPLLRIRGWGHLTGIGGLHLTENEAKAIQDKFGEYIVNQLNY